MCSIVFPVGINAINSVMCWDIGLWGFLGLVWVGFSVSCVCFWMMFLSSFPTSLKLGLAKRVSILLSKSGMAASFAMIVA